MERAFSDANNHTHHSVMRSGQVVKKRYRASPAAAYRPQSSDGNFDKMKALLWSLI